MALHVVRHPLIQHKLGILRDITTGTARFRQVTREVTNLLTYEATRYMKTEEIHVKGWTGEMVPVRGIEGKKVAVTPILRAGIGMLQGVLDLIPSARTNTIGLFRNEETAEPVQYYSKCCGDMDQRVSIILDPMLATGGSLSAAATILKQAGCKEIKAIVIVAAPEGVDRMEKDHPDIDIWAAELDERLNDINYILPGLGDAGDRLFGTK